MNIKPKYLLLAIAAVTISAQTASSQVLTAPLNPVFNTTDGSRDIALSIASPSWTLNQTSSDASSLQLSSIVGFSNTAGSAAAGWNSSILRVGTEFAYPEGTFAWHFDLPTGQTTTGGTITADVRFVGTPSFQKAGLVLGVGSTFTPTSGDNTVSGRTFSSQVES